MDQPRLPRIAGRLETTRDRLERTKAMLQRSGDDPELEEIVTDALACADAGLARARGDDDALQEVRTDGGMEGSGCDQEPVPFIDNTGEYPKAVKDYNSGLRCYHSTVDGGGCEAMGLSFDDYEEWRHHCKKFHPVGCGKSDCRILAAYRRDGAPHSYCFQHIPDDPDLVYAWDRSNTESIIEPPKADDDHPIEAALRGIEA